MLPGATSFTDLKTSTDGISYNTLKETAMALGLLESDDENGINVCQKLQYQPCPSNCIHYLSQF